jgi:hypothetical protein
MSDKYLSKIDPAAIAKATQFVSGVASPFVQQQQEQQWAFPDCGKRPFFIGRRRNEWNECAARERAKGGAPIPAANITPGTTEENFFQKNKTALLIGGGVVAAAAVFLILRKK